MGVEQSDPYEPVRGVDDVVKPRVYMCLPLTMKTTIPTLI